MLSEVEKLEKIITVKEKIINDSIHSLNLTKEYKLNNGECVESDNGVINETRIIEQLKKGLLAKKIEIYQMYSLL